VVSLDGNSVPNPTSLTSVRLAPAERVSAAIEMNQPGVWILGETSEDLRKAGMGVVIEYANQTGEPRWIGETDKSWDYRALAIDRAPVDQPDFQIPLVFESKFRGHGDFDAWMINGKSFPKTDPITLKTGKRYRLLMTNKSMDDHPIHLHRHTFEVTNLDGKPLSGLHKDVLIVKGKSTAEIDFIANNPGPTLFHCHQQSHMDFGFMMLFNYA
jgi:FtsP/CotA-like multicopper oxidase with cupredoxin domain